MYDKYLKLATELIAFKSISTDKAYADEIKKTAHWLSDLFKKNGFTVEIFEGYGNPVVFASYEQSKDLETVTVYGHYDVQPAEKKDGWDSEPFELTENGGKLYARGVVDNKGQVLVHIVSVIEAIEAGDLKYNVKFIIEGDEETGGAGLGKLLAEKAEVFSTDYVIVSDGEMPYKPVVTASFRGFMGITMEVRTANNNLHSGLYGGAVPNAAEEASRLVGMLNDDNYLSNIPDFYKGQIEIQKEEQRKTELMDSEKEEFLKELGIKKFFDGNMKGFCARIGFETMITVTGMKSGYIGEGYSNIVPNYAEVKLNGRIAAGHDPQEVLDKMQKFFTDNAPEYVSVTFTNKGHMADPIKIDVNTPKHKEAFKLLEEVYGDEVLVDFCGAIVPVVGDFQKVLNVEPMVISLGNEDCNMHGANENFDTALLKKGLEFSRRFFRD